MKILDALYCMQIFSEVYYRSQRSAQIYRRNIASVIKDVMSSCSLVSIPNVFQGTQSMQKKTPWQHCFCACISSLDFGSLSKKKKKKDEIRYHYTLHWLCTSLWLVALICIKIRLLRDAIRFTRQFSFISDLVYSKKKKTLFFYFSRFYDRSIAYSCNKHMRHINLHNTFFICLIILPT